MANDSSGLSEHSGWAQWYLYDLHGKQLAQVTTGQRPFGAIAAVDEAKGVMYVTAYTADGQEQQLFRAALNGSGVTQLTQDGGGAQYQDGSHGTGVSGCLPARHTLRLRSSGLRGGR